MIIFLIYIAVTNFELSSLFSDDICCCCYHLLFCFVLWMTKVVAIFFRNVPTNSPMIPTKYIYLKIPTRIFNSNSQFITLHLIQKITKLFFKTNIEQFFSISKLTIMNQKWVWERLQTYKTVSDERRTTPAQEPSLQARRNNHIFYTEK